MLQKSMAKVTLSATGATFARFFYSAPLVAVLAWTYLSVTDQALPALPPAFWIYGILGGLSQILATICVVLMFKQRNFAVGITFKKTEVIQTVIVGWLVLGEGVSALGLVAILIGLGGLLLLSDPPDATGPWLSRIRNKSVALGLASGVFFAISAVTYRGASLEILSDDPIVRASVTLSAVTMMQMCAMALWLAWREAGQITAVWQARAVAGWIGLTSMAGSFCWFLAFTLQSAAYVKAVGQIELIFSILASALFFKETIPKREMAGIAVLGVSIVLLIVVH
jgi:drug/metabolite transporter (DMT)-like permease